MLWSPWLPFFVEFFNCQELIGVNVFLVYPLYPRHHSFHHCVFNTSLLLQTFLFPKHMSYSCNKTLISLLYIVSSKPLSLLFIFFLHSWLCVVFPLNIPGSGLYSQLFFFPCWLIHWMPGIMNRTSWLLEILIVTICHISLGTVPAWEKSFYF